MLRGRASAKGVGASDGFEKMLAKEVKGKERKSMQTMGRSFLAH